MLDRQLMVLFQIYDDEVVEYDSDFAKEVIKVEPSMQALEANVIIDP